MKIEICESLAQSWLKHVRGCQVVQLNWKTTTNKLSEQAIALQIYEEATGRGSTTKLFEPIGRAGRPILNELKQFIHQAEIDAFGVKLDPNNSAIAPTLFAVDVAFHRNGLGYIRKDKVAMKMVRSALALLTGFGVRQGYVLFASPKVAKEEQVRLAATFSEIASLFEQHGLNYEFELLANETFENELLVPTIKATRGKTDTAELFMRSVQLLQLFPKALTTTAATAPRKVSISSALPTTPAPTSIAEIWQRVREVPTNDTELKIGAALQLIMHQLDADNTRFAALRDLPSLNSRLRMGSELTVFRPFTNTDDLSQLRRDSKNYPRYYADSLPHQNMLFSSQWNYSRHYVAWDSIFKEIDLL